MISFFLLLFRFSIEQCQFHQLFTSSAFLYEIVLLKVHIILFGSIQFFFFSKSKLIGSIIGGLGWIENSKYMKTNTFYSLNGLAYFWSSIINNKQCPSMCLGFALLFLYLQFMFVSVWQKNIGKKAERNMLMKLTLARHIMLTQINKRYRVCFTYIKIKEVKNGSCVCRIQPANYKGRIFLAKNLCTRSVVLNPNCFATRIFHTKISTTRN